MAANILASFHLQKECTSFKHILKIWHKIADSLCHHETLFSENICSMSKRTQGFHFHARILNFCFPKKTMLTATPQKINSKSTHYNFVFSCFVLYYWSPTDTLMRLKLIQINFACTICFTLSAVTVDIVKHELCWWTAVKNRHITCPWEFPSFFSFVLLPRWRYQPLIYTKFPFLYYTT